MLILYLPRTETWSSSKSSKIWHDALLNLYLLHLNGYLQCILFNFI